MSSGDVAVETPQNRNEGINKRMTCPLYGCKRVYSDANNLQMHIKDHELPAQSLPGKTMMCSTVGCGGTFPNMQKLMEHLRHHHKPNIYFLCESCHAKLRSYRGLLVHLRTCSKAARPKQNPVPSPSASLSSSSTATAAPVPMEVDLVNASTAHSQDILSAAPPPQLPKIQPQPKLTPIQPQPNQASLVSPQQDLPAPDIMQHIIDSTVNTLFSKSTPTFPLTQTQSPELHPRASTNEGQVQQQRPKTPEPNKFMPPTVSSTNVWRPGQGPTPERRVLWQHTRGRYTCVQCGHTVTNRREMTEHSVVHSDGAKNEPPNAATANMTSTSSA